MGNALDDPLAVPESGARAVRGGALRVVGYIVGSALAAGASILLLRYLGVVDFGRYATVMSLVAIVSGVSDVGLTLVGQREYVLQPGDQARRDLTANILGIRLVATPLAVGLAVLFATAAGYGWTLVLGTLIVGASLVFGNASLTMVIPLTARLRFGAITATELARQVLNVGGNALLVLAGAGLLGFFAIHIAAALGSALLAATFLGRRLLSWPRFRWSEWRVILREAAPMGAALIVSVLYLRALVLMCSVLTSGFETGLFATSYRVLEILAGVPTLMAGSAFPIMARAGVDDQPRLQHVLQRLLEASLLIGVLMVVVLAIAAEPILRILGGDAYKPAAAVLRIQSFALLGSFVSIVWTTALIAVRRQSALVLINCVALSSVLVLGGALIPSYGAKGAAVAAVVGEALLAFAALVMLLRFRPEFMPDLRFVLRLGLAAAGGALCALIPALSSLATAAIAASVYTLGAFAVGAVPREAVSALSSWRHQVAHD